MQELPIQRLARVMTTSVALEIFMANRMGAKTIEVK
jgi:hypothetical protein